MIESKDLLDYEIKASWWATFVPGIFADYAARYFVWKARRRYARYRHITLEENTRNIQLLP